MKIRIGSCIAALFLLSGFASQLRAQLLESLFDNLKPRAVGPATMGGRTVDFAVYEVDPAIFYAASASGGLLKTVNGGNTWENVFDRQDTVSIGDVAINPADPNVVWVGTGEANNRQSSSWGDGIYKSTDGGKTWTHMGLRQSHHIGRIVINPIDTDIVYVAALGHLWGANRERGIFMTRDGGLSWQHVLAIDENTGVVDIAIDPVNPKTLYAGAYARRRSAFGFNGGGPNGGVFKTVDGGRSWNRLEKGLPEGDNGRIGLSIYQKNPDIVYAIVENENGGIFRSDDKGESWTRVNSLNPRPMYYSQIRVDPSDEKRIYVLGTQLHLSDDGGLTFRDDGARGVHLDNHAFWINPNNPRHIMTGNDGGTWVSRDRSDTWEHLNNYPIGQFYHVSVDMQQPYWIYGGMQDNATWGGPSAVRDRVGIRNDDWIQMLACDGMYVLVDPNDNDTIYTNCQSGRIVRYDRKTGERKAIMPALDDREERLRFNWTTPIVISPFDSNTLYTAGNIVFKSTDRGHSWSAISEDLTTQTDRDELELMGVLGKDITRSRNDGISSYGNVTALNESVLKQGLIYAGTDDGKVHITRDGGKSWTDLTDRIPGVPSMLYVSRLTPSAFDEGTVYATFDGHRSDNFEPYVRVSTDHGQTWRSISSNLPTGSVYTLKEDTQKANVLYLGTEFGLFASIDRGGHWSRWSSVPTVAVYELVIHPREHDLVLGTHGRSFLVIDDVSPLREFNDMVLASASHVFETRAGTQFIPDEDAWFVGGRQYSGPNPEPGAYMNYYLKEDLENPVEISISDGSAKVMRELEGPHTAGLHRVAWDLRTEPVAEMGGGFYGNLDFGNAGPFVLPGDYQVKVVAGEETHVKTVTALADPLVDISDSDRRRRFDVLMMVTDMQKSVQSAGDVVRKAGEQLDRIKELLKEYPDASASVKDVAEAAEKEVTDVRTRLIGRGGGRRGGGRGGPQPVQRQIGSLKGELIHSQSPPSAIQSTRADRYLEELNRLLSEVSKIQEDTMPALYKRLADNKIWPTQGKKVDPIKP